MGTQGLSHGSRIWSGIGVPYGGLTIRSVGVPPVTLNSPEQRTAYPKV